MGASPAGNPVIGVVIEGGNFINPVCSLIQNQYFFTHRSEGTGIRIKPVDIPSIHHGVQEYKVKKEGHGSIHKAFFVKFKRDSREKNHPEIEVVFVTGFLSEVSLQIM